MTFDDSRAMNEAFASDHYRAAVTEDEAAMNDRSRMRSMVLRRRELRPAQDSELNPIKLITLFRAAPGADVADVQTLLATDYADALRDVGRAHEQLIADADSHTGAHPPMCDAVDIIRFRELDEALLYLGSGSERRAAWTVAAVGQSVGRLIAREIVVV
jgi:hypothetical protein